MAYNMLLYNNTVIYMSLSSLVIKSSKETVNTVNTLMEDCFHNN